MPDDELSWFRRYARREPLIVRSLITYTVAGAGYLTARWFGVELDTEAVVLLLLSVVGLAAGVAREGVYSPATVAKVAKHAGEEALLAAPQPPDPAPTATVLEVVGGNTIDTSTDVPELDRIVAALKKQGIVDIDGPVGVGPIAGPPPAPELSAPVKPELKPPAGLYVPDESITDTDGPGIPWAPTRVPPPPGLDR